MKHFANIHTHLPEDNAVVNIEPEQLPDDSGWFSIGIHPWRACEADTLWPMVEKAALHPHVVAIGECGLDAVRGPALDIQTPVFERHVQLSEALGKPLIIHAVRTWPQLISVRKLLKPQQEWIIHGFRGKAELAAELLRHGFSLSFGKIYNQQAFDITPPERRYRETDSMPDSL